MINGRKTESYIYDKKKIRNEWKKEKAFWGKERGGCVEGAAGGLKGVSCDACKVRSL